MEAHLPRANIDTEGICMIATKHRMDGKRGTDAPLIEDDTSLSGDPAEQESVPAVTSRKQEKSLFHMTDQDRTELDPNMHHSGSAKFSQISYLRKVFNESQAKRKNNTANNQPRDSAKAMERYVAVQQEIMRAIESDETIFSHYFEQLNSLRAANKDYERLFERDMAYYRTSPTKHLWNLFAGGMAFTLCFGPGTLTSNALSSPLLALAISPIVWSLTERLVPMLRATSWSNKSADVDFPLILRMQQRKWRDIPRVWGKLEPKKYVFNGESMTASQVRDKLSWTETWRNKVVSDDMTYLCYTASYTARSAILIATASSAFLNTDAGKTLALASLFLAGCAAGASTSISFQTARRNALKSKDPVNWQRGETLVKSREIWRAEATLIKAKIELLKRHREAMEKYEIGRLDLVIQAMEADLRKARLKSDFFGSIAYEFSCLFQEKRSIGDGNTGEVAGKILELVSGFLGKSICLLPSIVFNLTVAMVFAKDNYPALIRYCVVFALNLILIIGFGGRNDIQHVVRSVIGLLLGLCDVIRSRQNNGDGKYNLSHAFSKYLWPAATSDTEKQSADSTKGRPSDTSASNGMHKPGLPTGVHIDGEGSSAVSDVEDDEQSGQEVQPCPNNGIAEFDQSTSESA
jgi:hypothetical protein